MVSKAKSIPHGHAHLDYIKGESKHKKCKDKIIHITENLIPAFTCGSAIWDKVCEATEEHTRMSNNLIRIIISPPPEYTRDFTVDDWKRVWLDYADEFDSIELKNDDGEVYAPKTNIRGSIYTVELHLESESGVPHIHAGVCRVDKNDQTNCDHDIDIRAQRAAEIVARKRGWKTAQSVRESNIVAIRSDCNEVLQMMPAWNVNSYLAALRAKGYDIKVRRDKKGTLHGYTIKRGTTCYKASEIDRKLTFGNLEKTWQMMHQQQRTESQTPTSKPERQPMPGPFVEPQWVRPTYNSPRPTHIPFATPMGDGSDRTYYLPKAVVDLFNAEYDEMEYSNAPDLITAAVKLFVGMVDAATDIQPSSAGGGSNDQSPWDDRRNDEDDLRFARRCAKFVSAHIPKTPRMRFRR